MKPGVCHLGCCQQSGVTGTGCGRDGRSTPASVGCSPLQSSGRCPRHEWPIARLLDDGARSRRPACRDWKGLTVVGSLMYGLSWRSGPIRNVPLLLGIELLLNALPDGRGGFCSPEGTFERNTHHVVKDNRSRQGLPQLSWTHNLNTSDYISAASASQPPEARSVCWGTRQPRLADCQASLLFSLIVRAPSTGGHQRQTGIPPWPSIEGIQHFGSPRLSKGDLAVEVLSAVVETRLDCADWAVQHFGNLFQAERVEVVEDNHDALAEA
jgi:hypothetical protein